MIAADPKKIAFLQPWKTDLTRLGSTNDGGYVLSEKALRVFDYVVSAGISADWSFERELRKLRPGTRIVLIDRNSGCLTFLAKIIKELRQVFLSPSVAMREVIKWLKFSVRFLLDVHLGRNRMKFHRKWLSHQTNRRNNQISLMSLIEEIPRGRRLLLKIDIEGAEYQILDDLADWINADNEFSTILIEFHWLSANIGKLRTFIDRIGDKCKIVHVHSNNAAKVIDGVPDVVELTLENGTFTEKRYALPVVGIDYPNNPHKPDISVEFAK